MVGGARKGRSGPVWKFLESFCCDINGRLEISSPTIDLGIVLICTRKTTIPRYRYCFVYIIHSGEMHHRVVFLLLAFGIVSSYKIREDKTKCPRVKALRNFDLHELMGLWYVVEYYASSEEMPEYSCMRAKFTVSPENLAISMKFNYSFIDDPEKEKLSGNITWQIPDFRQPAHWVHAEDTYEGIYNTYVLDSDYNSFGLLLHCAEKSGSTRYLSSLVLSREPTLKSNIINYLREKLPRYDIDLQYMFSVGQKNCQEETSRPPSSGGRTKKKGGKNHPLKRNSPRDKKK